MDKAVQVGDAGSSTDPHDLRDMSEKVGRCRGFVLNCGALAVLCSTALSEEERAGFSLEFAKYRDLFVGHVNANAHITEYLNARPHLKGPAGIVLDFHARVMALDVEPLRITRDEAVEMARETRDDILPALYSLIGAIDKTIAEGDAKLTALLSEKAAMVDRILKEMGRIGRMIGLISINASVEAARAGGTSGRSFQVIAEEIRSLSRQSEDLLSGLRDGLSTDDVGQRPEADRARPAPLTTKATR